MKKELIKLPYAHRRVDRYPVTDTQTLQWTQELDGSNTLSGVGFLPLEGFVYDDEYFEKYLEYEGSAMSRALTTMRKQFVLDNIKSLKYDLLDSMVDVGVGSGTFVEEMGCRGTDVNPAGIEMLKKSNRWADLRDRVAIKTYWDSLEHIEDLEGELNTILDFAFVSCPVYNDVGHVMTSKHLRPDEHCWYWTRQGLVDIMEVHGFGLVEHERFESLIGREDIESFAFRRHVPKVDAP